MPTLHHVKPGTILEADAQQPLQAAYAPEQDHPGFFPKVKRACKLYFVLMLICLLLPFGGVHPSAFLPWQLISCAVLLILAAGFSPVFSDCLARRSPNSIIAAALLLFLLYALIQHLWFQFSDTAHPVLGEIGSSSVIGYFWSAWRQFLFFTVVYIIASVCLFSLRGFDRMLYRLILGVGLLAALIAISHWFYDNGKLFWTFEPEYVGVSSRARWPFVNSNHLAHFLLPVFFLYLARISIVLTDFTNSAAGKLDGASVPLARFIGSNSGDVFLLKLFGMMLFMAAVLLALIAALSRGSWFGLAVGLLVFLLLVKPSKSDKIRKKRKHRTPRSLGASDQLSGSSASANHPRSRRRQMHLLYRFRRLLTPLAVVFSLLLFYFFLQGKGTELLEHRIEYGLEYSKDDIRWTLYHDSLPMFGKSPFFGIGLSNWADRFRSGMAPELSGINPVYLHSDPWQFLIEVGLIGALPFLFIAGYLLYAAIGRVRRAESRNAVMISGLLCGLLAFFCAALFDFPLRVPVISCLIALDLALLGYYLERSPGEGKKQG